MGHSQDKTHYNDDTYRECGTWSHNFLCGPVAQPAPTKFTKVVIVTYSPNPIPNLKLLASTVAEISRGSQHVFWLVSYSLYPFGNPKKFGTPYLFL